MDKSGDIKKGEIVPIPLIKRDLVPKELSSFALYESEVFIYYHLNCQQKSRISNLL